MPETTKFIPIFALLLCAIATLIPAATRAQDWQLRTFDDGSFFSASISPSTGPGLSLVCGERSPQGLSAMQTGNTEPDITRPDTFRLYFSDTDIGAPGPVAGVRSDVMVVLGTLGYTIPAIRWNELFATWESDLAATDPLFAAIAAQPAFELRSAIGAHRVPTVGFASAFNELTAYCQAMFSAIGLPWRTVAAAPAARYSMKQVAENAIRQGCNGPATWPPTAILLGEIDGDGTQDAVLDWGAVTCSTGHPRPFCGASLCSADVYLSGTFQQRAQPESLLALGVGLQPLSNGNMAVSIGGSLSMCHERGQQSCRFLFYWTGYDLVELR